MVSSPDRRSFLRSALGGLAVGLGGCMPDPGSNGASTDGATTVLARPVLRPRSVGDGVWVATPPAARPVAYVSMATRQVFVDRAFRDRVSWLLDAHISVSTWVWRIPLPGDSPRTPIPPGDEPREFEEVRIGRWDPSSEPAVGDMRIVLGRPVTSAIEIGCAPVQGTDDMLEAGRLEVDRCHPDVAAGPVREDFRRIGAGRRHTDPDCGGGGRDVDVLGWAIFG